MTAAGAQSTLVLRGGVVVLALIVAGCSPTPTVISPANAPDGTSSLSPTMPAGAADPSPVPSTSGSPAPSASRTPTIEPAATAEPVPSGDLDVSVVHESAVSHIPKSVDDRAWEPVVATHPTDPERIAVVYEHRGPGTACRLNPTVRISHDGGRTWRSSKRSPAGRSGRGVSLHAAIAWGPGPDGGSRLYWANMTVPACGDRRFSLSTTFSDDEGATWSKLRVERRTPPWVGGFPEIAVDRDPASPDYGTVYVGYNWLARGARGPGFRLLASADFGETWQWTEIAPAPAPRGYRDWWRIAYRLRPDPDGGVYASWYQVDLHRWDRTRILSKGGAANVGRLAVVVAHVDFDPKAKTFDVGPSRIATTVKETSFTLGGLSAAGTAGTIRPDPMWLHGIDVDPASGSLYVAVAGYGAAADDRPRGTIRVGHSDDGGETWSFASLPAAPDARGHHRSSLRPNLVAGPGYVLVTFRTLDDVSSGARIGAAFAVSRDGGVTWQIGRVSTERWRAENLRGVVNGVGLRERAERLADGDVFWAYGDGRHARGSAAGRVSIYGALIHLEGLANPALMLRGRNGHLPQSGIHRVT
jgi:hypothetical protein